MKVRKVINNPVVSLDARSTPVYALSPVGPTIKATLAGASKRIGYYPDGDDVIEVVKGSNGIAGTNTAFAAEHIGCVLVVKGNCLNIYEITNVAAQVLTVSPVWKDESEAGITEFAICMEPYTTYVVSSSADCQMRMGDETVAATADDEDLPAMDPTLLAVGGHGKFYMAFYGAADTVVKLTKQEGF